MVRGDGHVLDVAARSGTAPGCGDCVWTLLLACPTSLPGGPVDDKQCAGAGTSVRCRPGQVLFRLFLTDDAVVNSLVDSVCLGSIGDVVPVGDIARADVARYLRDVTPPLLSVHSNPADGVPVRLPAYFFVRPPAGLAPAPFGGPQVRETITIAPQEFAWDWGDGSQSGWTDDAGAPYPDGTLTHGFARPGRVHGAITARWGGTYTITVAGRTFGPYDAIGTVTRTQPFAMLVLEAHTALVSHG
jgi:hypothetical protein